MTRLKAESGISPVRNYYIYISASCRRSLYECRNSIWRRIHFDEKAPRIFASQRHTRMVGIRVPSTARRTHVTRQIFWRRSFSRGMKTGRKISVPSTKKLNRRDDDKREGDACESGSIPNSDRRRQHRNKLNCLQTHSAFPIPHSSFPYRRRLRRRRRRRRCAREPRTCVIIGDPLSIRFGPVSS